jgi:hypothetical protein
MVKRRLPLIVPGRSRRLASLLNLQRGCRLPIQLVCGFAARSVVWVGRKASVVLERQRRLEGVHR